jgi:hypothetical protein
VQPTLPRRQTATTKTEAKKVVYSTVSVAAWEMRELAARLFWTLVRLGEGFREKGDCV